MYYVGSFNNGLGSHWLTRNLGWHCGVSGIKRLGFKNTPKNVDFQQPVKKHIIVQRSYYGQYQNAPPPQ